LPAKPACFVDYRGGQLRNGSLAVGLSLAILGIDIWYPALVIGVVAGALTVVGLELGARFGALLGRRMEVVGGLILIAIGVKILIEHLAG